jgi:hypothetical protein
MLPFPMFSSTNPPTSWPTPSFSSAFSAPLHPCHKPFPLFPQRVNIQRTGTPIHPEQWRGASPLFSSVYFTSLWIAGGWGSHGQAKHSFSSPSCFQMDPAPIGVLTPFDATLTKNTGGIHSSLRFLCALCVSALSFFFSFFCFFSLLALWPGLHLVTSLPLYFLASHHSPQVHETHFASLASHHMQAVPCGGSIQNKMSNTKYGGDCA